jgi:hypothetical protein
VAGFFSFPNPVNEKAARAVAGGVFVLSTFTFVLSVTVSTDWLWLLAILVYGFAARVLAGPRLSPLGQLATRVIAPRLGPSKSVAGPPKRFAQAMGLVMSSIALVLHIAGHDTAALVFVALIIVASALESFLGFCIGCTIFGGLMRIGWIPEETCEACTNIWTRIPVPSETAAAER